MTDQPKSGEQMRRQVMGDVFVDLALGNATDAAKQAADHVTDTCENDGVVAALRHFGVL